MFFILVRLFIGRSIGRPLFLVSFDSLSSGRRWQLQQVPFHHVNHDCLERNFHPLNGQTAKASSLLPEDRSDYDLSLMVVTCDIVGAVAAATIAYRHDAKNGITLGSE